MSGLFDGLEEEFQNTDPATFTSPGRVPPGTYKVMCIAQDPKGDGVTVDHEAIKSSGKGTPGLRVFLEILEPNQVEDGVKPGTEEPNIITTRGMTFEHTWWINKNTLPYFKRDAKTILGRDLKSMAEATSGIWAGKTFEAVVRDDEYEGRIRSRVNFINPWRPSEAPESLTEKNRQPDALPGDEPKKEEAKKPVSF